MKYCKLCLGLICMMLLVACGGEKEQVKEEKLKSNEIYYYYANKDYTDVIRRIHGIDMGNDVKTIASTIIEDLSGGQNEEEIHSPIPENMSLENVDYDEEHERVTVRFLVSYENLETDKMVLAKACIVNTILQLNEVKLVNISLRDQSNTNSETATVTEQYDKDSFVMSFNDNNGYAQKGNIVLYFANENGDALKEYNKSIEISNNMSLAAIVVESLIDGPQKSEYQATIPENTSIRNILVKDGICYVDFSDEFYDTDNPLRNDLIVYSIVNSLVELPTVSKVQFLKNGERIDYFRESMPFDALFERNLDLIEQ